MSHDDFLVKDLLSKYKDTYSSALLNIITSDYVSEEEIGLQNYKNFKYFINEDNFLKYTNIEKLYNYVNYIKLLETNEYKTFEIKEVVMFVASFLEEYFKEDLALSIIEYFKNNKKYFEKESISEIVCLLSFLKDNQNSELSIPVLASLSFTPNKNIVNS